MKYPLLLGSLLLLAAAGASAQQKGDWVLARWKGLPGVLIAVAGATILNGLLDPALRAGVVLDDDRHGRVEHLTLEGGRIVGPVHGCHFGSPFACGR